VSAAGADLIVGFDVDVYRAVEKWVPPWEPAGLGAAGALAGIEQEQPFVVFDQVGVDRQRLGPVPVEDYRQPATHLGLLMSVARWDGRMRMVPVLTARMVVAMSYSCRWERRWLAGMSGVRR
jgi:hypothetical protein